MGSVKYLSRLLYTEANTETKLKDVLLSKPTLVVLLRQGECIECTMVVDELQRIYSDLIKLDVPIVFIANGSVSSLSRIRTRLSLSTTTVLLTEPTMKIYADLGLKSSMIATYGPKGLFNIAQGWMSGFSQSKIGVNQAQQSGAVLFDAHRELKWIQFAGFDPNR